MRNMLTPYVWHFLGSVLCIIIIIQQWTIQMAIQEFRTGAQVVPQVAPKVVPPVAVAPPLIPPMVTKVVTAVPITNPPAATTEATFDALPEFDERLLSHVKSILVKPNNRSVPYALQNPNAADYSQEYTGTYILSLLKNKTNGFFFECGAFDGETFSNSLALEKYFNWTGLLVEGSPKNVKVLLTKKRRSWISPTCLSTTRKSMKVTFLDSTNTGKILGGANHSVAKPPKYGSVVQSFCVPFNTLMKVLDIKHIDYLTLDVEGPEYEILQTIDFKSVTIDVMAVEFYYRPPEIYQEILKIMTGNGFVMVKKTRFDSIFVHSRIYQPSMAATTKKTL
ncbi:uncharacterized protein LOC132198877 [Neocloeon triangulifer]|uniref:uncharacterized protein LOC132198877 n=1 Tax=Neocloeon triangulifer TaxID=2078957 RepID=UPI00286F3CEE|nr:uncharacterized protein LOC132198877 [Neocloeon triangulifer]